MVRCGYGTYLPEENGAFGYEEFRREVNLVEAVGLDGIFFAEHHGLSGYFPSPLGAAMLCLGMTTRLRAGTAPLLLPLHDPVRVAEDVALADRVSGGRIVLGVAAGYLPADFEQIGVPLEERGGRLEEGLQVLDAAWRGAPVAHRGRFYRLVQEGPLVPLPLQRPRPPIWIAGTTRRGIERAARYGDALIVDSMSSRAEIRDLVDRFRAACAEVGRAPQVVLLRRVWIGDRAETAAFLDEFEREVAGYLAPASAGGAGFGQSLRRRAASGEPIRARVVVGEVAEVAERLAELAAAAGSDYLVFKLRWRGTQAPAVLFRAIERAGEVAAALAGIKTGTS